MGFNITSSYFSGLTTVKDRFYNYPQSLIKQLQTIPIKDPLKYSDFDMTLGFNSGIIINLLKDYKNDYWFEV